ncbi:MAG TPA: hypothetical protein VFA41_18885 [Ktedonobacteraceae bacterium]|nr:hypothetical protein [Ktedonobacteraceae bacterium]
MTTFSEVTEYPVFDSLSPQHQRPRSSQRRPGPKNPRYGISPEQWPDVLHRIEQGETLRQIAKDYSVSYETIRRTIRAARKRQQQGGEQA